MRAGSLPITQEVCPLSTHSAANAQAAIIQLLELDPWLEWFDQAYLQPTLLPTARTILTGQRAMSSTQWFTLCAIRRVYQIWTRDSVAAIQATLVDAQAQTILEVGAGDGRLTRALARHPAWTVVGQDDGSWAAEGQTPPAVWPLRRESLAQSLAAVQPDTVLVSWMPYESDWTVAFRACPSVRQYVVIGEGPSGCTGTDAIFDPPPPWSIQSVPDFERGAVCRTDVPALGARSDAWIVRRGPSA